MLCEGTCVFKGRRTPPIEIVRDFWVEIIHTLRGQLEQLQGSSDRMQRHREAFLRLWRDGPYTELSNYPLALQATNLALPPFIHCMIQPR